MIKTWFLEQWGDLSKLNLEGKMPCEMDRLARVVRICEKTAEQDLINAHGMKSMGENLEDNRLIIVRASAVATGGKEECVEPVYGWSEGVEE